MRPALVTMLQVTVYLTPAAPLDSHTVTTPSACVGIPAVSPDGDTVTVCDDIVSLVASHDAQLNAQSNTADGSFWYTVIVM